MYNTYRTMAYLLEDAQLDYILNNPDPPAMSGATRAYMRGRRRRGRWGLRSDYRTPGSNKKQNKRYLAIPTKPARESAREADPKRGDLSSETLKALDNIKRGKSVADSVIHTYRTMAYLLGEDARIHRGEAKREKYHPSKVPEPIGMWLSAKHKIRGHDSGQATLSNRELADAHHQHEVLTKRIGERHGNKNTPAHMVSHETEMMAHHAGRDDIEWDYNTGRGRYRGR